MMCLFYYLSKLDQFLENRTKAKVFTTAFKLETCFSFGRWSEGFFLIVQLKLVYIQIENFLGDLGN